MKQENSVEKMLNIKEIIQNNLIEHNFNGNDSESVQISNNNNIIKTDSNFTNSNDSTKAEQFNSDLSSSNTEIKVLGENEIKKRLIERDYFEIHSYIKKTKRTCGKMKKCFKNKYLKGYLLRAEVEEKELQKQSLSLEELDNPESYRNNNSFTNTSDNIINTNNKLIREQYLSTNNEMNDISVITNIYTNKEKKIEAVKNIEVKKIIEENNNNNIINNTAEKNNYESSSEIEKESYLEQNINKKSIIHNSDENNFASNYYNTVKGENNNEDNSKQIDSTEIEGINISNKNNATNENNNDVKNNNCEEENICETEDVNEFKKFYPENVRKGMYSIIISEKGKEDLIKYAEEGPQFSESVKKQNEKVLEEYLIFCNELKLKPFPLDNINSIAFLHFLGENRIYNIRSIDCVVRYSLLRLNLIKSKTPVDEVTNSLMKAEINSLYKNKNLKQPSDGMTPIIVSDMKLIIHCMPDYDPQKPKLASMFLFALSTGSRASTVAGIKLCNLLYYYNREDKFGNWSITIKQDIRKSNTVKYKTVSLSGKPGEKDSLNFIYWLDLYLSKSFKTNIKEIVNYNANHPDERTDFLWPISTKSMSACLRKRVQNAGMKLEKIGMHSLRSGFLTSAILSCNGDERALKGVMERCAMVADWEPYSVAQNTYIKSATRQAIIATDLIGITATDEIGLINSKTTEHFHHITLSPPSVLKSYSFLIKDKVKELTKFPSYYNKFNTMYFDRLYNAALYKYAVIIFPNEKLTYSKRRSKTIRYINEKIKEDTKNIEAIANILYLLILDNKKHTFSFDNKIQFKESSYVERRNNKLSRLSNRKVRRAPWSTIEQSIFNKSVQENKSLKEISELLYFRSYNDCYDHLRAVNRRRKSKGLEPIILKKSERKKRSPNSNFQDYKTDEENNNKMDNYNNENEDNNKLNIEDENDTNNNNIIQNNISESSSNVQLKSNNKRYLNNIMNNAIINKNPEMFYNNIYITSETGCYNNNINNQPINSNNNTNSLNSSNLNIDIGITNAESSSIINNILSQPFLPNCNNNYDSSFNNTNNNSISNNIISNSISTINNKDNHSILSNYYYNNISFFNNLVNNNNNIPTGNCSIISNINNQSIFSKNCNDYSNSSDNIKNNNSYNNNCTSENFGLNNNVNNQLEVHNYCYNYKSSSYNMFNNNNITILQNNSLINNNNNHSSLSSNNTANKKLIPDNMNESNNYYPNNFNSTAGSLMNIPYNCSSNSLSNSFCYLFNPFPFFFNIPINNVIAYNNQSYSNMNIFENNNVYPLPPFQTSGTSINNQANLNQNSST